MTRGGRGGKVIAVTNLNDSGPGSLRAAVEAQGPRTVVFRVSGTIVLESPLRIRNPFITIAGQTAPGDGITLRRHPIQIDASEVIIRYLRVRLGDESGADADAISSRYQHNIVLDHLSVSWSIDETLSVYHCERVTVQWCLVAESLYGSNHIKGAHGFGGIWGSNYSTYHHNLLAHHSSRNPRFASGSGYTDFRNNVVYNWGHQSTYGGENHQVGNDRFNFSTINMVANYYKPGPATLPGAVSRRIVSPSMRDSAHDFGKWYVAENVIVGNPSVTSDNWAGGVQPGGEAIGLAMLRMDRPWPAAPIRQQTAEQAYRSVLALAGASLPARDRADRRVIEEVRDGTATYEGPGYRKAQGLADRPGRTGIIDSQTQVGGWPELRSQPAPSDSDGDGMPDAWEKKYGLDPHNAADAVLDTDKDGYTNIEEHLNGTDPTQFLDYTLPENNISALQKL